MARPETIQDIEPEGIQIASIELHRIGDNAQLLRAYADFMTACQRVGVEIVANTYSSTVFKRVPTEKEMQAQLESEQCAWDHRERLYRQLEATGRLEEEYMRNTVEAWAKTEGMPWPPQHEPIESFDAVIRDIDEVVNPGA